MNQPKNSAVVWLLVYLLQAGCTHYSTTSEDTPNLAVPWRAEPHQPRYSLGVPPVGTTRHLWETYHRLIAALNVSVIGFAVRLESAQTRDRYALRLRSGEFDFALVDSHDVFEAEKLGYSVFAKVGAKDRIGGLLVVRKDSNISGISDLQGKKICFGSPSNLAGTMMVRKVLYDSSRTYEQTATVTYAASEESALLQALWGLTHAAGTSRRGWIDFLKSHPEASDVLRAEWETRDLPGPAVMAHERIPAAHVEQIAAALVTLRSLEFGEDAISAAGFHDFTRAQVASYRDVGRFLTAYARAFPSTMARRIRQ